jgi:RNA polymerase sigma-70 factor (ECF subfamily)
MSSAKDDAASARRGPLTEAFVKHRARLLSMIRNRLNANLLSRLDAEDVLSETYLVAERRWKQDPPDPEHSLAWLYRIALDCIIQAWRKQTRGPRDVRRTVPWPEQSSLQLAGSLMDSGTSPSLAYRRKETRDEVAVAVEKLPESDRQLLWMRHREGMTHKDVSLVLGISENAATVRYVRALERLRNQIRSVQKKGDDD